jgi:hypothetical protein
MVGSDQRIFFTPTLADNVPQSGHHTTPPEESEAGSSQARLELDPGRSRPGQFIAMPDANTGGKGESQAP